MPKLIILGSSNGIPDELHENTHFAIQGAERTLLVDCVSNPILRLRQAGLDFNALTDLILTHFHPDHVSGVPLLLMDMWLLGRKSPLNVYGLHHTIDRVEQWMGFFDWSHWPDFFPVAFHRLPASEMTPVMSCSDFRVFSSPVRHLLPAIGLRLEFPLVGKAMAYSCDTEPCPQVAALAAGVHLLLHEATGALPGHSTAAQAAEIALQAQARSLFLIHYPTGDFDARPLVQQARQVFEKANYAAEVRLAEDFMQVEF